MMWYVLTRTSFVVYILIPHDFVNSLMMFLERTKYAVCIEQKNIYCLPDMVHFLGSLKTF